jgi:branched-chain amino acid transport system substrate-binding protein
VPKLRRIKFHSGFAVVSAIALTAGSVTALSAGSAAAASSSKTIQIAWETALSGATSAYTIPTLHGAQLAISQLNAKGGIDGKKLVLDINDDGGSPTTAAALATKFTGNKAVVAGLGLIFGPEAAAALKVTNAASMPFISFDWTNEAISEPTSFRVSMDYAVSGAKIFNIFKQFKNIKKIVLWANNDPGFTTEINANLAQIKQITGITPTLIEYPNGATDVSSEALQLFQDKPDLVYDEAEDAAGIAGPMKEVERLGGLPNTTWIGPTFIIPTATQIYGPAVTSGAVSDTFIDYDKPQVKTLEKQIKAKFGEQLSYGQVQGYDAVNVLAAAMRKDPKATTSRSALLKAMNSLKNVPTVAGPVGYTFSFSPGAGEQHDAFRSPSTYQFVQLKANGSFAAYTPKG